MGPHITQGLGAGAKPEIGKAAAEEAADELYRHLDGAHMVFITAGMGGGTGTGAAPVIARMARERNILTVGVVTKPFGFEGVRRARCADQGIEELQQYVDTLIVIPNQNLFRMANERTTWKEAFKMADQVLYMGVRGVTDLMMAPGLVNLDFADIRTVMAEMGKAMMGTGEAEGENRAIRAAEAAISNPLLEDTSMTGARGLLINITGGDDLTLFEVDQAANRIREEVDEEANIIFGSAIDRVAAGPHPGLGGRDRHRFAGADRARASASGRGGRRRDAACRSRSRCCAMSLPAGAMRGTCSGDDVHPLRQAAPQVGAMADAMPETSPMMEAAGTAAPQPIPHPSVETATSRPTCLARQSVCRAATAAPNAAEPPRAEPVQPRDRGVFAGVSSHAPAMAAEPAPVRAEPAMQEPPRVEPPRASVRQTAGDEVGLDIPAFLRRQSS